MALHRKGIKMINPQEKKYLLYSALFALIWFVLAVPSLMNLLDGSSPLIYFLIFNVAVFLFLQVFLKSFVLKKLEAFRGALGVTLLFMAIDIWQPPFMLNTLGQLSSQATLSYGASDYIVAFFLGNVGIQGFVLYIATYVIAPIVLLAISGLLIKDFTRRL